MIYPDKNHGIYGGNTRLHLYKKMTNFINKTLGDNIKQSKEETPYTSKVKG
jgi:dipeptidyl-peptidase-4